jgi:hypothetical protein
MTRKFKQHVRAAWLELHNALVIATNKRGVHSKEWRALSKALNAIEEIEDESGAPMAL